MGPPPASGPFFSFVCLFWKKKEISAVAWMFSYSRRLVLLCCILLLLLLSEESGIGGGGKKEESIAQYNVVCSKNPVGYVRRWHIPAVLKKRKRERGNKCCTCIRLCDPISTWRIVSSLLITCWLLHRPWKRPVARWVTHSGERERE